METISAARNLRLPFKLLILIVLAFLIIGCSNDREIIRYVEAPTTPVENDPRNAEASDQLFTPYLEEWVALHPDSEPIITPISFDDIPEPNVLGVCITWRNGTEVVREIIIDRPSFTAIANSDSVAAKIIIFHELGHCELLRPHLNIESSDQGTIIPWSIMFSSLFSQTSIYSKHYDHYTDELFGGQGYLLPVAVKETFHRTIKIKKGNWEGTGVIN